MIRLSCPDHQCVTARCWCLYELRRTEGAPVIAASLDIEAVIAAKRLLVGGGK